MSKCVVFYNIQGIPIVEGIYHNISSNIVIRSLGPLEDINLQFSFVKPFGGQCPRQLEVLS